MIEDIRQNRRLNKGQDKRHDRGIRCDKDLGHRDKHKDRTERGRERETLGLVK